MGIRKNLMAAIDRYPDGECYDCFSPTLSHKKGSDYEYYMLHNWLWEKAGDVPGFLCLQCVERRIGRELDASDFTDCPLNKSPDRYRSERLQNRLETRPLKE